jgi:hypothetical protein
VRATLTSPPGRASSSGGVERFGRRWNSALPGGVGSLMQS